ncbi:hypothetical protein G9A89_018784 [Geosiphon pyriformis]|nr:hypothetical protein G9A89_018784 [Geosiphon pyriformis]
MHLKSTLLVFAPASVMVPALQMAATFFALIDRLTANLVWLLKLLAQAIREKQQPQKLRFELHFNQSQQFSYQRQQNYGPPVYYHCGLIRHFSKDYNNFLLSLPAFRNNNNQNNKTNNNNAPNQRLNYININFFGKNPLVKAIDKSTSQPKENPFYTFNLTNDDYNMDKLAINISELTRKKKKTNVDFVLDPNKAFISTVNNNKPPKTKVFKTFLKLKLPEIVQKSGFYSIIKDLMETPVHITFGQLITHSHNIIPLICKAQVAGYFIDLILDSKSSVSVIAKHFLEAIRRKIDELSIWPITNVHGDKKKDLDIAKAVPVCINGISIKTDIEKAKALFHYKLCKLTIRYDEKSIVVKCYYWTVFPVPKQNQEDKQLDKSDNNESNKKED